MTPCEKLGYKVGDRFEVVEDCGSEAVVGSIIVLYTDDGSKCPLFYKVGCEGGYTYCPSIDCIRPLKPQTEAEKRGAKFGTMGVVKATGERVVFNCASLGSRHWAVLGEGKAETCVVLPSEIRLDHEPEYKEIPFSEATDEQRRNSEHITGTNGEDIQEIYAFANGAFGYTIKGSNRVFHETSHLTVRVPA